MSYTNRLIKYAHELGKPLQVERCDETHRYKVSIENVVYKKQHLRMAIFGMGFTIEDACYDVIRKSAGDELENCITNKIVQVI